MLKKKKGSERNLTGGCGKLHYEELQDLYFYLPLGARVFNSGLDGIIVEVSRSSTGRFSPGSETARA